MKKLLPILFLGLLAVTIIFYRFNGIPKNLSFDEVEFTKLALSLDGKPYTPYSTYATGHATLYFYTLLFSFKIFGVNNFALRLPAAIFGVLNVMVFYFILQSVFKQWKNYTPFILSLVFITSRWYFNFARFAFEATFLLFLELSSIYFLFRYLQSKQTKHIMLTAIFAGLAYNSYPPGRIFFFLILIFLIIRIKQQWSNETVKQCILSIIIFILTILPLSLYLVNNPDIRFNQQFFLKNSEMKGSEKIAFLGENIKKATFMFNLKGDINGRHNYPDKSALNPVLGLFFIFGLIIALKNWQWFPNNFFLAYFALSLIPALLTYPWENPNMLRTYTTLPSIVFFVGKSLESIFKSVGNRLIIIFIFFLLFLSSIYEIRTYFKYQSEVFKISFEIKKDIKQIDFNKPITFKQLTQ